MNLVPQRPLFAFAVALAAVAALSLMDAVMKRLVIEIGTFATLVWRAQASLVLGALVYLPLRQSWPRSRTVRLHVARGIIIAIMGVAFFWGLGRTPLAQAIALTFIAPLIALGLSSVFLKEEIGKAVAGGSLLAFAGVLLILYGQASGALGSDALLGSAAILFSALCYAVNIVLMRSQALAARPPEITFFQNATIAAIMIASLPLMGPAPWPSGHWPQILVASGLSTLGLYLFAIAYARGKASYLSVTEYSAFVWAGAFGWLLFGEKVSPMTLAGAALIVAGCLIAARKGAPATLAEPEIGAVA